tara:strand:+ start:650 stop:910 length:261 start_codon:yes stop_codon:yes gene_type:complete
MVNDSWKRPVHNEEYIDCDYVQQLELQLNKTREATPQEVEDWQNGGDFFMTGNFDALKLFVVLPTLIQLMMMGFMFSVFWFNANNF